MSFSPQYYVVRNLKAVNPPLIFDRRSDLRLACGPIAGRTAVMPQHTTQLKQSITRVKSVHDL